MLKDIEAYHSLAKKFTTKVKSNPESVSTSGLLMFQLPFNNKV